MLFRVIDVNIPGKLLTSAWYDKQLVCAINKAKNDFMGYPSLTLSFEGDSFTHQFKICPQQLENLRYTVRRNLSQCSRYARKSIAVLIQ